MEGSVISLSGTRWPAGDLAYAYLDLGSTSDFFCNVDTDSTGALGPQTCTVPSALTEGTYTLLVTDGAVSVSQSFTLGPGGLMTNASSTEVTASAPGDTTGPAVRVNKAVALTPGVLLTNANSAVVTTSAVGDTVDLAGSRFTASSTITKVAVGTTVAALRAPTPSTSATGSFSGASFVVPAVDPGAYTVTVTDAAGRKGTVVLTVFQPTLTAPSAGTSGVAFAMTGSAWPAGDHLEVSLNQGTTNDFFCNLYSHSTGSLASHACVVPKGLAQGAYTLEVTDGAVSVRSAFTIYPAIALTNTGSRAIVSAAPGTTVDLSGTGFTASSMITKLAFGSTTVAITLPSPATSTTGVFSGGSFTVPSITPGTYTVTATDAAGQKGTVTFEVA